MEDSPRVALPGRAQGREVLRAPLCTGSALPGPGPESSQAEKQAWGAALHHPGARGRVSPPAGPADRTGARPPPPGPSSGLARRPAYGSRPRSLLDPRARRARHLAAGRPRARGPPGGGGARDVSRGAARGCRPLPPLLGHHARTTVGRVLAGAPGPPDVGLQALTSAGPPYSLRTPRTHRNTGGGAGPEILGPHR